MNMMARAISIGIICFLVYFWVATQGTFQPKWSLDYFNPMAASLVQGRLDLPNTPQTYDLAFFQGKWYAPWGILPAIFLIPAHILKGRYIPPVYLALFFGSLNVSFFYLLLERVKRDFFPSMRLWEVLSVTVLFAFGTINFYLSTLGSVWQVDQVVSASLGTLGLLVVFHKKRTPITYILSSFAFALTLLGRATIILTIFVPLTLFILDEFPNLLRIVRQGMFYFGLPCLLFVVLFFAYNYLRFGNIFEYGYSYIVEAPYLSEIRETRGIMSFANLRNNLWYFLFEVPKLTFSTRPELQFNLLGNSIFFLTPPLLAVLMASPWYRLKKKWRFDPYIFSLWVGALITIFPSLMIYSTGWVQFGYRYSLDITHMLLLLSVFGLKGRLNILYIGGAAFALWMYWMGIHALM